MEGSIGEESDSDVGSGSASPQTLTPPPKHQLASREPSPEPKRAKVNTMDEKEDSKDSTKDINRRVEEYLESMVEDDASDFETDIDSDFVVAHPNTQERDLVIEQKWCIASDYFCCLGHEQTKSGIIEEILEAG